MKAAVVGFVLFVSAAFGSNHLPRSSNYLSDGVFDSSVTPEYHFPTPQVLRKLPATKPKNLHDSLNFGESSIGFVKRLEQSLKNSGIGIKQGTPEHGFLIGNYPTDEALNIDNLSSIVSRASINLAYKQCGRFGATDNECANYISEFKLGNSFVGTQCNALYKPSCFANPNYRSFDGSCNNQNNKAAGRALTAFKRTLPADYSNGIDSPRLSLKNKPLPSARIVSSLISPDVDLIDSNHTLALMQWTQFIEHDLVHIPVRKMLHDHNTIRCCDHDGEDLSPRHQHPSCYPISVPRKDPFYGSHWVHCMPYTRSITTFRKDCAFGPAEQMNQATHFLDGSHIYGSNDKIASLLRENSGGLMKSYNSVHGSILPILDGSEKKNLCQIDDDSELCFKSGDSRVNMHPYLATMHILWLREHNRIANELSEINPHWNDEKLYQEARRVNIGKLQHITYQQWLPLIIGNDMANKYNISHKRVKYNPSLDPSVANSFATAALRFHNSLLDGNLRLLNEDRSLNGTLTLMDHFNNPTVINSPRKYEQLLRGMISQQSQQCDVNLIDDITQKFYARKNMEYGLDVLSLDIQRGRDHGIPGYHQFRALCGLNPVKGFDDFADTMSQNVIDQLKTIYADARDVDLIVGALAEKPSRGSLIGPTMSCLLTEQFIRTRSGDKYFYSNINQPKPFSRKQIVELEKSNLARVICDNVPEIKRIQRDVFTSISDSNPLVSCSGIQRTNLSAWKDNSSI